jgi:hypothetical protein
MHLTQLVNVNVALDGKMSNVVHGHYKPFKYHGKLIDELDSRYCTSERESCCTFSNWLTSMLESTI